MSAARRRQLVFWALSVSLAYTLNGFFVVPRLIKTVALWQIPKRTGRQVELAKVRLNPFTASITLDSFVLRERDGQRFVAWDRVFVNANPTGLLSRQLVLAEITISNAFGHVQVNRDGTFNFTDILQRFPPDREPAKPSGEPMTVRVGHLRITGSQLVYDDLTRPRPFSTTVGPINLALRDFSTDPRNTNPYHFAAATESGEKFSWSGSFSLGPVRSAGEFAIEGIKLAKYAPYYDDLVSLTMQDGRLDVRASYQVEWTDRLTVAQVSNLTVNLRDVKTGPPDATNTWVAVEQLTLSDAFGDLVEQSVSVGAFSTRGLRCEVARLPDGSLNLLNLLKPSKADAAVAAPAPATTNAATAWRVSIGDVLLEDGGVRLTGFVGEESVQWRSLHLASIAATTTPVSLAIESIVLSEPRVEVRLLTNLVAAGGAPAPAEPAAAPPAPRAPPPPLRVGSIIVTNGFIAFADQSLTPEAALTVNQLDVAIHGLSSAAAALADLRVGARVDNVAPIEVTGRINPLSLDAATTLQALVKGIDLAPVGSYSGKYAGYLVRKGKLSLEVRYEINQRNLQAANKIVVDQFTFGEATGSPDAVKLPVKLAVAVLKDRHGKIEIDVPVEGRIDDPKFRYWGAVWHVLGTLFTRILTAPFSMLGSMFGGGGEELSYQQFAPGRAALVPEETKKLDVLIKALTERPALVLEITGSVDPIQDAEPLKRQKLLRQLLALRAAREPGQTNALTETEYAAYLRQACAAALAAAPATPPAAAPPSKFFSNVGNLVGPGPRPAKPVTTGAQARKAAAALSVPEMERLYLPQIELTADDWRELAKARAASVVAYLTEQGSIPADRLVFSTNPNVPAAREGARVLFGLQ